MLDAKLLREQTEEVASRLATRGQEIDLTTVVDFDNRRRELLQEADFGSQVATRYSGRPRREHATEIDRDPGGAETAR